MAFPLDNSDPIVASRATSRQTSQRSHSKLWAANRRIGSAVIVGVGGAVDASNLQQWKTLLSTTAAAAAVPGPFVVDIREVDCLTSRAYQVVARQASRCRRRGVDLYLVSDQPIVTKVAAAVGLRDMVPMCPTVEAALSAPAALAGRLRITPGMSIAVINYPAQGPQLFPTSARVDPDHADVVVGFVTRCEHLDLLDAAFAAARDGRLAWVVYPKPGRLGSDLYRDQMARAVLRFDVQSIAHVSLGDMWSALLLEPMNDHPAVAAAEMALAWPTSSPGGRR